MTFSKLVSLFFLIVMGATSFVSFSAIAEDGNQTDQSHLVQPLPDSRDRSTQIEAAPWKELDPTENQSRLDPSVESNFGIGVTIPLSPTPERLSNSAESTTDAAV